MKLFLFFMLIALCAASIPALRSAMFQTIGNAFDRMAYAFGIVAYFTDPETQKKVVAGVEKLVEGQEEQGVKLSTLETQNKELTDNFENLQKETKDAFKDLERTKSEINSVAEGMQKLSKIELQLKRERRMAYGDPVQRLLASEENRLRLNAEIRRLCDPQGESFGKSFLARAEVKSLTSDSGVGATLIDDALAREIYDLLETYGAWATLGVRSVGTKTTKYPVKTARPVAKFVRRLTGRKLAEDTAKAGNAPGIDVELIGCLVLAEMELLEDSEVDLSRDILDDLVQALNYRMDYCVFSGAGADDELDGEITGIFEGGTAHVGPVGDITVASLGYEEYLKTTLAVDPEVLSRSPRWWMHQQQLVRALGIKDDNGRAIFNTALEAPSAGAIGSILGYPVTNVSAAPNAEGASKKIAAFGDSQSYIVPIRKGVTLATSDDYAFDEVSRAFRGDARFGGGFRKASGMAVLTTGAAS